MTWDFCTTRQGKTDDSIAAYRKSVAAKPGVFESNLNLGLMLVKAHQPDAEQFLRAATKLKPTAHVAQGQARAWLSLGHLLETSNPEGAIEAFKQAALLDPKDTEPHLSSGPILEGLNRFADAEQEYKQAFAIDPSSADALTGMANIYMRGHRYTEAEEILRKLVALHPNDAGAHMQLGRMLAADGQNDPAIAELQVALKLAPSDPSLQLDLADLYVRREEIRFGRSPVPVSARGQTQRSRLALRTGPGFPDATQVSRGRSGSCWPQSSSSPAWAPHTAIWPRPPTKTRIMNW